MSGPMKFAYADPPYLRWGKRHYGHQHEDAAHWDSVETHAALITRLHGGYPDGWAVSLHAPALETYLEICCAIVGKDRVRVGSWVKPFASFKPNVNPGYCWEPVIFFGGRTLGSDFPTVRDYVSANITLQRGTKGAKPEAFCNWLFQMLGMRPDDELTDLFPGSGAVTRAWEKWRAQGSLVA